jgi:proline dehydrogenase
MALKKEVLRFVAGERRSKALKRIHELNKHNIKALIDVLGEKQTDKEKIASIVNEYKALIRDIKAKKLYADIDLKLTNIGLAIDRNLCFKNLIRIVALAHKANINVWIDAEELRYRDAATHLYHNLSKTFPNIFLTVQAYSKDALQYVHDLLIEKAKLRLVKGTYKEKEALHSKSAIRKQYSLIMKHLFLSGNHFAIATHDEVLLSEALELEALYKKDIEFQFLMGLSDMLAAKLGQFGYGVAEYIPYGKDWQAYYKRRCAYLRTTRQ